MACPARPRICDPLQGDVAISHQPEDPPDGHAPASGQAAGRDSTLRALTSVRRMVVCNEMTEAALRAQPIHMCHGTRGDTSVTTYQVLDTVVGVINSYYATPPEQAVAVWNRLRGNAARLFGPGRVCPSDSAKDYVVEDVQWPVGNYTLWLRRDWHNVPAGADYATAVYVVLMKKPLGCADWIEPPHYR
jgi:hypothetical protein